MNHLVEISLQIALKAHSGQIDKAGQVYILHPLRVMARMDTDEERAVALLHDVIEDTEYIAESLLDAGIPLTVVDTIQCLTKRYGENYEQFIRRILTNELAVKIKIADIEDNLDVLRLDTLGDDDLERIRKYHTARKMLDRHGRK